MLHRIGKLRLRKECTQILVFGFPFVNCLGRIWRCDLVEGSMTLLEKEEEEAPEAQWTTTLRMRVFSPWLNSFLPRSNICSENQITYIKMLLNAEYFIFLFFLVLLTAHVAFPQRQTPDQWWPTAFISTCQLRWASSDSLEPWIKKHWSYIQTEQEHRMFCKWCHCGHSEDCGNHDFHSSR